MKKSFKRKASLLVLALLVALGSISLTSCDLIRLNDKDDGVIGSYTEMNYLAVVELMQQESGYIMVDVSSSDDFSEKHIEGAVNIPLGTLEDEAATALPDLGQRILLYGKTARRSKKAAEKLVRLGYTNVVDFGSIDKWEGETVTE